MDNAINISISPIQILLASAFQIWIIVFPIILIRKINYLTALLTAQTSDEEEGDQSHTA